MTDYFRAVLDRKMTQSEALEELHAHRKAISDSAAECGYQYQTADFGRLQEINRQLELFTKYGDTAAFTE